MLTQLNLTRTDPIIPDQTWPNSTWPDPTRLDATRLDSTWRDTTRPGSSRRNVTWLDSSRHDLTRPNTTLHNSTRHNPTWQDLSNPVLGWPNANGNYLKWIYTKYINLKIIFEFASDPPRPDPTHFAQPWPDVTRPDPTRDFYNRKIELAKLKYCWNKKLACPCFYLFFCVFWFYFQVLI